MCVCCVVLFVFSLSDSKTIYIYFYSQVENMEKWFHYSKSSMMRPTTINKFGVVLDDFGLDAMLQKLLDDFISPISQGYIYIFWGICLH